MRARLPLIALGLLLALTTFAGVRGLDFGRHWDERHLVGQAHQALRSKLLLPRSYHYPSMSFWLATTGLALGDVPEKLESPSLRPDGQRTATAPAPALPGDPVLRIRLIFLLFSSLIGLWTYLAARAAELARWPAVFAAAGVATSFELGYHQRWIAPDAVMAQLGALALWLLLRARGDRRWLLAGAVAAGLCCGAKYTGGIFLFGALGVAWAATRGQGRWRVVGTLAATAALFGAAYLLTTPGTLLDYGRFLHHLSYELAHYAKGHGSYSVPDTSTHLAKMGAWLGGAALSPWPTVAWAWAALALLGLGLTLRRGRRWLLVVLPLAYLLFLGRQRVLIVRNLLILLPFLAIWAAIGAAWLAERLPRPALRVALGGLLAVPVAANATFAVHASQTIVARRTPAALDGFRAWCDAHPGAGVRVSARLARDLGRLPACAGDAGDLRALYLRDGQPDSRRWPTQGEAWALEVFGPRDVNLRWYGSWLGDDRVIVLDAAEADRLKVRF
ncbi:MAG: glycosyltransferase family 39 protein [Myxococcales bacterium]|nr:glycosyltransferase family 39 protein [Myxococcales bacterium]